MIPQNEEYTAIIKACTYAILAVVGGFISYLSSPQPFTFKDFLIKGISSGFTGILIGLLCIYGNLPIPITYFLCGTCGYIGSEATIALLRKYVERNINKIK